MGKSALLIDHSWCLKILRSGKCWEIRNKPCKKRGRIVIATTAKTSPTGTALQLGEATLSDCIVVGRKREGFLSAPVEAPSNFLFLKRHLQNHQITSLREFPILSSYETVYAWVLKDPVEFATPVELHAKRGCVVWVNLEKSRSTWNPTLPDHACCEIKAFSSDNFGDDPFVNLAARQILTSFQNTHVVRSFFTKEVWRSAVKNVALHR